jgi:hypothetical protein
MAPQPNRVFVSRLPVDTPFGVERRKDDPTMEERFKAGHPNPVAHGRRSGISEVDSFLVGTAGTKTQLH